MKPTALIVRAPGTNCDIETSHAFHLAGAQTLDVHVNQLLESPAMLEQAQILCIPGGFSYGDDIAAGRIMALSMRSQLGDALHRFRDEGNCILGICNGFQVLLQTGLLIPDNHGGQATATLALNDSGHYVDRWVHLKCTPGSSIFLGERTSFYLPVAHAEGKFVVDSDERLEALKSAGQIAMVYTHENGSRADDYPANPNGSMGAVAGLADSTGRVLGLMPHPERYMHRTQHPRWTRESLPEAGEGLAIFQNAVEYFATFSEATR